jgi:hypothetical protein
MIFLLLLLLLIFAIPRLMAEAFFFGMWLAVTFPGKGYYILGIAATLWILAMFFVFRGDRWKSSSPKSHL